MIFHVKDDFREKTPLAAVGAGWFNKVGGFINGLVVGLGLRMHKPARPGVGAPVVIELDPEAAAKALMMEETEHQAMEKPSAVDNSTPTDHRFGALIETEWKRGKKGVSVYLPTDSWGDNSLRSVAWRLCHFDRYGSLEKIEKQSINTQFLDRTVLDP